MLFKLVSHNNIRGVPKRQMGRAVNPLTSVFRVQFFPPPQPKNFDNKERDKFGFQV